MRWKEAGRAVHWSFVMSKQKLLVFQKILPKEEWTFWTSSSCWRDQPWECISEPYYRYCWQSELQQQLLKFIDSQGHILPSECSSRIQHALHMTTRDSQNKSSSWEHVTFRVMVIPGERDQMRSRRDTAATTHNHVNKKVQNKHIKLSQVKSH